MPYLLHVDTDGLEHAARDLSDAAAYTADAARTPIGGGLYRGIDTGPASVRAALKTLQQRTEEAHSIVTRLSEETRQMVEKLHSSAHGFGQAENLCTLAGG